jgi:hypothetical protein
MLKNFDSATGKNNDARVDFLMPAPYTPNLVIFWNNFLEGNQFFPVLLSV